MPGFWPLLIKTDSKYVINGLTKHLGEWEDKGWIGVQNARIFRTAAYLLKRRTATTHFEWVKGHNGDQGNEESDKLAKEGAEKDETDELILDIPVNYDLQGAKLATITQATAYKGICDRTPPRKRPTTERNLRTIKLDISAFNKTNETSQTIWKNIQKQTIRPKIQQFIFKTIHGTFMIGKFWENIPDHEYRQWCSTCHTTESMEHILFECTAPPARTIWDLAKTFWPHAREQWPEPSLGTVLGCGLLAIPNTAEDEQIRDEEERPASKRGPNRLLQILYSESAYLIWVLRCERTIQLKDHTEEEIERRWLSQINQRLTNDKITATKIKKDAPTTSLIIQTWKKMFNPQTDPERQPTWLQSREVLVGRRTRGIHHGYQRV